MRCRLANASRYLFLVIRYAVWPAAKHDGRSRDRDYWRPPSRRSGGALLTHLDSCLGCHVSAVADRDDRYEPRETSGECVAACCATEGGASDRALEDEKIRMRAASSALHSRFAIPPANCATVVRSLAPPASPRSPLDPEYPAWLGGCLGMVGEGKLDNSEVASQQTSYGILLDCRMPRPGSVDRREQPTLCRLARGRGSHVGGLPRSPHSVTPGP